MTLYQKLKRANIAAYKALAPAEREAVDNDQLVGFIIRCAIPRADVHDAIERRMDFISAESKEIIFAQLQAYYSRR